MAMGLGRKTLLINPPLVNGVAFTRQGRCQEREDVLGTTKPPYTLALLAELLRRAGCDVKLIDATASRMTTAEVIAALDRDLPARAQRGAQERDAGQLTLGNELRQLRQ